MTEQIVSNLERKLDVLQRLKEKQKLSRSVSANNTAGNRGRTLKTVQPIPAGVQTVKPGSQTAEVSPDFRKYVATDIDDYFDNKPLNGHHKCIGCAKCVSPHKGKIIEYKYPKTLASNNARSFAAGNLSKLNFKGRAGEGSVRVSWDYDKLR